MGSSQYGCKAWIVQNREGDAVDPCHAGTQKRKSGKVV